MRLSQGNFNAGAEILDFRRNATDPTDAIDPAFRTSSTRAEIKHSIGPDFHIGHVERIPLEKDVTFTPIRCALPL